MGSLTSTPKIPEAAISRNTASAEIDTPPVVSSQEAIADAQEQASTARKQSLLARGRSRYGTVVTSLQGVLSNSNQKSERKTLLGQ